MKSLLIFTLFFSSLVFAEGPKRPAKKEVPAKKSVSFEAVKDHDTFKSPFKIKMNVTGYTIRPAGEDMADKKSGHHHLIINAGPIPAGQVVPADDKHIHYGKGQTEAELTLPPGEYNLTLQFADGAHLSYGPSMSKTVQIHVVK
jgi:hypothetical protein